MVILERMRKMRNEQDLAEPKLDLFCEECGVCGEDEKYVMCDDDVLRCWNCYCAYMRVDEDLAAMKDYEFYGCPEEG